LCGSKVGRGVDEMKSPIGIAGSVLFALVLLCYK
jgi:hypothetical protein